MIKYTSGWFFAMAFAISFDEDLPFFRKEMRYGQFYPENLEI